MPSERKTILVTGTAGFIGFHVASRLLERGCEVIGVDSFNDYYSVSIKEARSAILRKNPGFREVRCDISNSAAFKKALDGVRLDKICHLAAQAGVRYSLTHPHVYTQSNVEAFLNILEAARHGGVGRLVYASSSSVYGGNTKIPFSESDAVDNPISLYAATKRANELMAHCYSHLYGFQTVGLRFFTVYGPWGRPDMAMWIFAESILDGRPINVFNFGKMRRDFTYIDDIVSGVVSALFTEGLAKTELFNLGNHRSEDLMKMINIIETCLGKKASLNMLPLQPGDVPESYADISLAEGKLSFKPSTPIDKGIPAFIDWYKSHPDMAAAARKSR